MNTTLKIAAFCAALCPVPVFADGDTELTEDQLNAFRAAIVAVGCTINDETTASAVEDATGFDPETLQAVVEQLRVYDEIVDASDEGGITYISGECAS
ncbi:MAG: hypothetical protein SWN98_03000 [Pseudomonadota bacterium]|jgi:ABC-type amino acid transport substrate-binding protein|uniref:ABC-type amino acid transport substrate-binding protein n=1 Tax=Actibacterium naphthalenivorans TaxID=1614693 RepID=A0A840C3W0_9RHOB|nr:MULTISPECIES: hypothetical protein [Actibacterium]ALG89884.1 hypothetical protein TQ29_06330 [Actibacterium sp. EMB200-NS6]KGB81828.1 hypothetical protein JT55_10840 [Rhodovulum sp. NI22]MBB4020394.1 ABC-type amino acid transport substrate-binding protein [Actibacterium naphthalenivorans]MDY6858284.1 hypothetical protein [Pseudomonadota bacterium]|tara:strand:+ start:3078 stop:3371 length:294 start_codon:yes stop_codon:yes gene_type:complete